MPSKSKKQHNLMVAVANNPAFAKKVGIPQSVGQDFEKADKGRKFREGGSTNPASSKINKQQTHHGSIQLPNVSLNKHVGLKTGGSIKGNIMAKKEMHSEKSEMKMDKKQDVALIKKAFKQHDAQEHKGSKGTSLKLAKGGAFRTAANGIAKKGLTKGTQIKMCGGGMAMKKGKQS